jgi:hypothetical protein
MTLSYFLSLCLAFAGFIFSLVAYGKGVNRDVQRKFMPPFFYAIIALFLLLSYNTIQHYTNRSDDKYYKNTDHHILLLKGYEFSKGRDLHFYHDNSNISLLGDGYGQLTLCTNMLNDSILLKHHRFDMPLYFKPDEEKQNILKKTRSYFVNYEEEHYGLINNRLPYEISSGSTILIKRHDTDTLLQIKYEEVASNSKKNNYGFYFRTMHSAIQDSVVMSRFHIGYELSALLSKGLKTVVDDELEYLFRNSCFVRQEINIAVRGKQKPSPLFFFPGNNLLVEESNISIFIDDNQVNIERARNYEDATPVMNGFFYTGLNQLHKTEFRASVQNDKIHLNYKLPEMYYFPKDSLTTARKEMFVTTSLQDIIDNVKKYNHYYKFAQIENSENPYNASFLITYADSTPNIHISPLLNDFNKQEDESGLMRIRPTELETNEVFTVETKAFHNYHVNSLADLLYRFEIKNLNNNPVTKDTKKNYLILIVLFAVLYSVIWWYQIKKKNDYNPIALNKWLFYETLVYIILLSFLTVRLVLLWRLYSFPPLENITHNEYISFFSFTNYNLTFTILFGLLVIRIIWFILLLLKKQRKKLYYKMIRSKLMKIVKDFFKKITPGFLIKKRPFQNRKKWNKYVQFILQSLIIFIPYLFLSISFKLTNQTFITIAMAFGLFAVWYCYIHFKYKYNNDGKNQNNDSFLWFIKKQFHYIAFNGINLAGILVIYTSSEQGMLIPFIITLAAIILLEAWLLLKKDNTPPSIWKKALLRLLFLLSS